MQLRSLRLLLVDELEEVYIAEQMVREELGRMEKGASNMELKNLFRQHSQISKDQVDRLETVFEKLQASPRGGRAQSMKVLLSESEDRMGDGGDAPVVDAALIAAGRRIQHWGIASYDSARLFADRLGLEEVAGLLAKTVEEKRGTDNRLADLATKIPVKGNNEI